MHDVGAGGAEEASRADEAAEGPRRGQVVAEVERGDGNAGLPELGGDLAARAQRVDVRDEAAPVEIAQHLLEVPLRAPRVEQRGEVGDARHAGAARA